ncbi:MAG: multidrug effflux MFS transporter [Alphaproteobacteria bacterium]|nr:multidrug effflux MFS transporter [Alphaproteobacteria bacterium]
MKFLSDPASRAATALLVLIVAIGPISTDLYLPALPGIQAAFDTDVATVQLTLSVYMIAFAFSQLIYGPLSDRFGRRPVILFGLALYFAASIACIMAPTMEVLIGARFVQAVGGCAGQVIVRAIVRDVHGPDGSGRVLAKIAAAMGLAPLVGPILGGYLTDAFGWQACFVALSAAGGLALLGGALMLSETNRMRDPAATSPRRIARNIGSLTVDPRFISYTLCAAGSYSGLFAFISGSSFVFISVLGLEPTQFSFCFSAAVLGFIIGARTASRIADRRRAVGIGATLNAVGGLTMLLFLLAGVESVATVLAPMVVFSIGMGIVLPHAQAGAVAPYPEKAGTASALYGTFQYAIASGVGLLVGHGFDGSALPMAWAIALSGVITFACFATLLWRGRLARIARN